MLTTSLAPYLLWAKTRAPAAIDLAGSNLLHCTLDDLPGLADAVDVSAPNDNGFPPLVESIAKHYGVDAGRVVTAQGCSGANFIAIAALVGHGDRVLVERPSYDPLIGAARLMGAAIDRFERRFEHGWVPDLDDLRAKLTPATKLVIVTSPHNPSGTPIDASTLDAIGRLAATVGAHVLVDEVYLDGSNLIDETRPRTIPAAQLDGPFLSTSSLTKSYGLAGLRSGWIVAPPEIVQRLRRTRDVVDNASSAPADRLAAAAFDRLPALVERTTTLLRGNAEIVNEFLEDHDAIEVAGPPTASVCFPRLAGESDSAPFVKTLLEQYDVAVAPGHFFDAPAHFRISLAGKPENLARGLERLSDALDARAR